MTKGGLTLIKGGLTEDFGSKKKSFVSAYVTNTRLMGVVGLYIHWDLTEENGYNDLHQFFYFDAEEYGLDTYKSVFGNDMLQVEAIESSLIEGLGGDQVDITRDEAIYLVQKFAEFNESHNIPTPEPFGEYQFILDTKVKFTQDQDKAIMLKQCVSIESPYHAMNYFVMRCFGKDFEAANLLCKNEITEDFWPEVDQCTLCLNTIDPDTEDSNTYMCESLLDCDDAYYLATSQIIMEGMVIVDYQPINVFKISGVEANFMLAQPEFISVYEGADPSAALSFNRFSTILTRNSMITPHDDGTVYMIFNPHNGHVNSPVFRLNGDVLGIFYVTNSNQIIASSFTLEGIRSLEYDLMTSTLGAALLPKSKYQIKEPILFEFIQSGMQDFEEFIDLIGE